MSGTLTSSPWQGTLYDVRVDDHPQPLAELRRLIVRQMAYALVDSAARELAEGDADQALMHYRAALALDPDDEQLRIWALFPVLATDRFGRSAAVEADLRNLFDRYSKWVEVVRRYVEAQPLQTEGLLERILALGHDEDAV